MVLYTSLKLWWFFWLNIWFSAVSKDNLAGISCRRIPSSRRHSHRGSHIVALLHSTRDGFCGCRVPRALGFPVLKTLNLGATLSLTLGGKGSLGLQLVHRKKLWRKPSLPGPPLHHIICSSVRFHGCIHPEVVLALWAQGGCQVSTHHRSQLTDLMPDLNELELVFLANGGSWCTVWLIYRNYMHTPHFKLGLKPKMVGTPHFSCDRPSADLET